MLVCPPVFKTGRGWSRAVRMGSIPIHPRQKQASCGCTATGGLLFFAAFYRKAPYLSIDGWGKGEKRQVFY